MIRRIVPTAAIIAIPAITSPFVRNLLASHPPPRMMKTCTAPKGRLNRIASKFVYPKEVIIRLPNVLIPPLGMLECACVSIWMEGIPE